MQLLEFDSFPLWNSSSALIREIEIFNFTHHINSGLFPINKLICFQNFRLEILPSTIINSIWPLTKFINRKRTLPLTLRHLKSVKLYILASTFVANKWCMHQNHNLMNKLEFTSLTFKVFASVVDEFNFFVENLFSKLFFADEIWLVAASFFFRMALKKGI